MSELPLKLTEDGFFPNLSFFFLLLPVIQHGQPVLGCSFIVDEAGFVGLPWGCGR